MMVGAIVTSCLEGDHFISLIGGRIVHTSFSSGKEIDIEKEGKIGGTLK